MTSIAPVFCVVVLAVRLRIGKLSFISYTFKTGQTIFAILKNELNIPYPHVTLNKLLEAKKCIACYLAPHI